MDIAQVTWGESVLAETRRGGGAIVDDWDDRVGGKDRGLLRPGEDFWAGEKKFQSWEWEVIGGGVSGAIAAADLYIKGFRVSTCVFYCVRACVRSCVFSRVVNVLLMCYKCIMNVL